MRNLLIWTLAVISLAGINACSKSRSQPNPNGLPAAGDVTAAFTIGTAPGQALPATFTGLSFEVSSLLNATYFSASNTTFVNLIKGLGQGIIRIGGNSADKTGWTGAPRTAATASDSLTTSDIDRFFGFAAATGWKVMFTLNLGTGTAAAAANEAAYIYQHYNSQLLCFEIGNEPDLYSHNGLRPTTYTYTGFAQQFESYYDSIKAAVPDAVFSGPAAAGNTTTWVVPFAADEASRIVLLTEHYYKMGPPTDTSVTIANLLNGNTNILKQAAAMAAAASAHNLPYRIAECNSVYDGGKTGVSNTLASALWGLDYVFALAEQGDAGVNFHGGGAGAYTPIAFSNGQFSARPLYYGMLLYAQAASGSLLTVTPAIADSLNCTAHAVLRSDGAIQVILINKDETKNAFVTVSAGRHPGSATALRLAGPAIDSTSGITLGGAGVDAGGSWLASAPVENAAITDNGCTIRVPAASAALVTIR